MASMMVIDDQNNPQFEQAQAPTGIQAAGETPWWAGTLEHAQKYGGYMTAQGIAWRSGRRYRRTRTILQGGFGTEGEVGRMVDFNPRSFVRSRSQARIVDKGAPFLAERLAKEDPGPIARAGLKAGQKLGVVGEGGVFDVNMASRLQAAGRIERTGLSSSTATNVGNYLNRVNPDMAASLSNAGPRLGNVDLGGVTFGSSDEAAMALRASGRTTIGQMAGGYASVGKPITGRVEAAAGAKFLAARESGEVSTAAVKQLGMGVLKKGAADVALESGEKLVVDTGLKAGTKMLAERGAVMAGALAVPVAGEIFDIAMLAWTAFDLMKMGGQILKQAVINPAMKAVKEGYRSFVGQAGKAPFGMGYVDNEVAATSRARGVQAIQNSRLNARSLLGSEGSMMYAHFG